MEVSNQVFSSSPVLKLSSSVFLMKECYNMLFFKGYNSKKGLTVFIKKILMIQNDMIGISLGLYAFVFCWMGKIFFLENSRLMIILIH